MVVLIFLLEFICQELCQTIWPFFSFFIWGPHPVLQRGLCDAVILNPEFPHAKSVHWVFVASLWPGSSWPFKTQTQRELYKVPKPKSLEKSQCSDTTNKVSQSQTRFQVLWFLNFEYGMFSWHYDFKNSAYISVGISLQMYPQETLLRL